MGIDQREFDKAAKPDLDFQNARSSVVVPAIGGHLHVRRCLVISFPQMLLLFDEHEVEEVYGLWCQGETIIQAKRQHAGPAPKRMPKGN